MIVQVIPEHAYQIDSILPGGSRNVPWCQNFKA